MKYAKRRLDDSTAQGSRAGGSGAAVAAAAPPSNDRSSWGLSLKPRGPVPKIQVGSAAGTNGLCSDTGLSSRSSWDEPGIWGTAGDCLATRRGT